MQVEKMRSHLSPSLLQLLASHYSLPYGQRYCSGSGLSQTDTLNLPRFQLPVSYARHHNWIFLHIMLFRFLQSGLMPAWFLPMAYPDPFCDDKKCPRIQVPYVLSSGLSSQSDTSCCHGPHKVPATYHNLLSL